MNQQEMLEHLHYHYWATERMLEACKDLDHASLTKDLGGPFGTLFATLVHQYSAEHIWLSRWQGQMDAGFFAPEDIGSLSQLRQDWQDLQRRLLAYIKTVDLTESVEMRGYTHQRWQMLHHVIDHASFHRGQVMHMLRELGQTPPQTNLIHYLRAQQTS